MRHIITEHPDHQAILAAADNTTKHEIIGLLDGIAVLHAWHKPPFSDARYTAVVNSGTQWRHTSRYFLTPEEAMLDGIGHQTEGLNSQFARYASRMLRENPYP